MESLDRQSVDDNVKNQHIPIEYSSRFGVITRNLNKGKFKWEVIMNLGQKKGMIVNCTHSWKERSEIELSEYWIN